MNRLRFLTVASLGLTSGWACTGSTVALTPHVEQQKAAPVATTPCEQASSSVSLATPELAIRLYVENLAANNFAGASRAFAVHENAARVDFIRLVSWVRVFSAGVQNAPAEYPMFVELNELRAKAELAQATKFFVYSLLTDRDPEATQVVESEAELQAFVQAVNPARLAKLRVLRIDEPRKSLAPEAQQVLKKQAALYGADEMTERVALYELADQLFWSGFQLCRYDKTWKIRQFAAYYAGPPYGTWTTKTTRSEYEARIE